MKAVRECVLFDLSWFSPISNNDNINYFLYYGLATSGLFWAH